MTITGQSLDGATELRFSDPEITAEPMVMRKGNAGCRQVPGYDRRRLPDRIGRGKCSDAAGFSSPRMSFAFRHFPKLTQTKPSTTLESALPLGVNSICNAAMPARAINHYRFECDQGQRVIIDCAAKGIDSKLNPV